MVLKFGGRSCSNDSSAGGLMASATVRRSSQFLGRVLSYLGGQGYNFGGKSIRENDVELGCSFHEIITGELEHPQSCTSIKENICSSHLNLEQECQRKALDSTTYDLLGKFREKGYATCGSIGDVCTLFNNMFERNVVSWNTMIGIYARSQDVLELLYDMKVEGILPNTFTFITILNAFDIKLSQSKIRFTHSHIVNSKLDSDMAIQSALISTYGESSQFNDAKVVFDRITKHDARSWTAMIKTYGHNGLGKGAIDLYWEMTKEGIIADKRVIMSVLHVVSMCTMPCHGKQIHACILFSHFKMDIFVLNMLLNMYGKFGLPRVAWDIFVKTDKLNIVSWNSIIATYTQNGHRMEALQLFSEMVSGHMMPDRVTFITILDVFSGSCALAVGKWVHSFILAIKLDAEISVGNALLNMYKKCGSWEGSVIVFDHMPVVSVVSWTVMVALCIQHGYDKFAIQCLLHMQLQSLRPNKVTFVTLVDAYTSGKFLPSGRMVHACIIKNGVELADVGTCLINMYGRCGSTVDAQLIFHRLQDRNVISWNAVTTALLCNSLYHEALQHFYQMHLLEIAPDEVTFSLIFSACEVLAEGKKLHACFIHNALNGDSIIDTALVDMYGKLGSMEDVWKIFNRINEKDTPSWNVMISLCALHKHGREALSAFRSMLLENMVPDNFTYVSLLDACGSQSMLGEGKCIHSLIIEYGYESDVYISNALISMYGNCGKLHDARACFERMLPRNAISWTAITSVHAQHGYGGEALRFFHEMHSDGHAPDVVSLVSILSACRHGGLTNEACYFFVSLSQDYSIKQTMEHYNCMICLLRQTESMDIAEDLMNYMPFVLTPLSCVVVKETLLFNKFLYTFGQRHSKFLHVWFSAGVIFGILTMLAAVLVFALDSSKALLFLSRTASVEEPSYLISPVVPGINVPWADVGYISFGTAIAIALHELGHALAATSEGVHVEHVAAFVAVIFLGALVALDTEALQLLSPLRALRIYCAGVWHNIMCCAGCWLILQSLPSLLFPFYSHNLGVLVCSISPQSPLSPHLKIGDAIKEVNGISVHSSQELVENLLKLSEEKTHSALGVGHISKKFSSRGYCVPLDVLNGTELVDNHTCSSDSFPFSQVPPLNSEEGKTVETGRVNCLRAMNIIRHPPCGFTWTMSCPLMQVCMKPKVPPGEVFVTLDFIPQNFRRCQHSNDSSNCKNELIFVGEVGDLLFSLQFGNYLPRSLGSYSAPYWLPQVLEKLLTYLFNISAAIAILNSAPVFYFDGQDMLHGYLRILGSYISPRRRRCFMQICLRVCSFVLICEILRGFVLVLM